MRRLMLTTGITGAAWGLAGVLFHGAGSVVHELFLAFTIGGMIAGSAEILAGLCLLLPRGGILGAVLLSSVMIGALGVTIGQVASAAAAAPAYAQQFTVSSHQAVASPCLRDAGRPVVVQRRSEWDI